MSLDPVLLARDLIRELLEWFIGDVVDELGSRPEVEYAYKILETGTSADRQLEAFQRTNDLHAVVDQLIRETEEGVLPSPELTRTDERQYEFRPVTEVEIPIAMRADAPNGDGPAAMVV